MFSAFLTGLRRCLTREVSQVRSLERPLDTYPFGRSHAYPASAGCGFRTVGWTGADEQTRRSEDRPPVAPEPLRRPPVAEFTPLKLKSVRQGWADAGIVLTECNRRVGMVKRVFILLAA